MTNPLEQYSRPLKTEKTKCGTIFWLNPRRSKPGREFIPLYDERFPFVIGFKARFLYYSNFLERNNTSGNHYHNIKQEILIPLHGNFEVVLEDVDTKEKESISLNSAEHTALYIPIGISHKVISKDDRGVLLVVASTPSSDDDEIEYNIS
jgi:dTDP-4-dehydrorhamnose 3,5-epimerase-like enzyme